VYLKNSIDKNSFVKIYEHFYINENTSLLNDVKVDLPNKIIIFLLNCMKKFIACVNNVSIETKDEEI
jgi:hypothetical protein